jgi:uncharacterized protein
LDPVTGQGQDLNWLVTGFAERVPDVAQALVVSSDGVPLAVSEGVASAHLDRLAAITSGLMSLFLAVTQIVSYGPVTQTLVAMERGTLIIMAVSDGSSLAVLTTAEADLDLVAYEMTMLVEQAGAMLTPGARNVVR